MHLMVVVSSSDRRSPNSENFLPSNSLKAVIPSSANSSLMNLLMVVKRCTPSITKCAPSSSSAKYHDGRGILIRHDSINLDDLPHPSLSHLYFLWKSGFNLSLGGLELTLFTNVSNG